MNVVFSEKHTHARARAHIHIHAYMKKVFNIKVHLYRIASDIFWSWLELQD